MKEHEPNKSFTPSMEQRGFTLIELMAVLAAVAVMLAFVIPSLTRRFEDLQAEGIGQRD